MRPSERQELIRQTAAEAHQIAASTGGEAFLRTIEQSGMLPPDVGADEAARAVVCTLSRRLSIGQARALFDSLPPDVQSALGSCDAHRELQGETFGAERLVQIVGAHFPAMSPDPEALVRVVFLALRRQMTQSVWENVAAQLPRDLADMWLSP